MQESIGSKTKSGLYWSVALKIPYEIFRFFASILTARLLDPKDFGIVSIATMVIYYSNTFTNIGFNQALVQREAINSEHIGTVFSVDLILSAIAASLVFIFSGEISEFFNSPESERVLQTLAVVFFLTTVHDLPYVLMRRDIEFKIITLVDMARETSMSVLTVVLAYLGYKYWAIVWGHIVPLSISALYLIVKVKYSIRPRFSTNAIRDLLNFSLWSFVQMQVYFLSSRIDRIFIGRYLDTSFLGIYEKSKSLSQMPTESVGLKINTIFFSSFSRFQNEPYEIRRYFGKGILIISLILFPIYFGLYAIAPHFVIVLLGEKWESMIRPFEIMAIAGVFSAINGIISALATSTGLLRQYTMIFIFSTVVFIIAAYFSVHWGLNIVAWAFVLYTALLFILSFNLIMREHDISFKCFFRNIVPALISSSVMLCAVYSARVLVFDSITIANLLYLILIGMLSYIFIIFLIKTAEMQDFKSTVYGDVFKLYEKFIR